MSVPALLGYWYALSSEDKPFVPGDPDWSVSRIVEDDPALPNATVETDGAQQSVPGRNHACDIAVPLSRSDRSPHDDRRRSY